MTMLCTLRWKLVHYEGLPAQLFDLEHDPDELNDRGRDPDTAAVRAELLGQLFDWLRQRRRATTIAPADIESWNRRELAAGIRIGVW